MRLFLIKRRSDGKFLRSQEAHYSVHSGQDKRAWSDKPQIMLRTPDGVAMNLRKLCSEPYRRDRSMFTEIEWRNFNPDKLSLYEVVIIDVDVIAMKATPATDFAQIEKIATIPLTRAERQAA